MNLLPDIDSARRIGGQVLGNLVTDVRRLETGRANFVFDLITQTGQRAVIRFIRDPDCGRAGIHWSNTLRPLGIPLPKMIASHVANHCDEFSWQMLERFDGTDLGTAYPNLITGKKYSILNAVLHAQQIVHRLPPGRGFGYASLPDQILETSWADVIVQSLERSRRWIMEVGATDDACVDRVLRVMPAYSEYFQSIRPIAFLDDTTTRNVIVSPSGEFAGIVDVDEICYGDPLTTAALTHISLLNLGYDTEYTQHWLDCVHATSEQRRAFLFYSAVSCVCFIGEQGQQFNQDKPPVVDQNRIERLLRILDGLLKQL